MSYTKVNTYFVCLSVSTWLSRQWRGFKRSFVFFMTYRRLEITWHSLLARLLKNTNPHCVSLQQYLCTNTIGRLSAFVCVTWQRYWITNGNNKIRKIRSVFHIIGKCLIFRDTRTQQLIGQLRKNRISILIKFVDCGVDGTCSRGNPSSEQCNRIKT